MQPLSPLQGWLKTAQPKTYPKDGDGHTIWNGPESFVKAYRTKPGDISLSCAPLYPSLRLPPPFPDSLAPPRPIRLSDTASAGVGWLALQHKLNDCQLGDAKAIGLFKRLPSLAGAHLVFLLCVSRPCYIYREVGVSTVYTTRTRKCVDSCTRTPLPVRCVIDIGVRAPPSVCASPYARMHCVVYREGWAQGVYRERILQPSDIAIPRIQPPVYAPPSYREVGVSM